MRVIYRKEVPLAMVNRVRIEIQGGKYVIATPENEEYVKGLSYELDRQVTAIMGQDTRLSLNECLVLCCMSYLDGYKKSEESADRMRGQLSEYLEDAAKARIELDETKRELEQNKRQLEMSKR
ncbi:MAG: cell division protein ZapA [Oscillospiraceae bacterium]